MNSPVKRIKQFVQDRILKKKLRENRTPEPVSFQKGGNVLIIYHAASPVLTMGVSKYSSRLKKNGFQTDLLGYIPFKHPKDQKPQKGIFYRNDLRFFDKPPEDIEKRFGSATYDYLLIISDKDYFPLTYLAATCKARLKAGNFTPARQNVLDFMLKSNPEDENNTFFQELDQYLNIIHKK